MMMNKKPKEIFTAGDVIVAGRRGLIRGFSTGFILGICVTGIIVYYIVV